jgi:hypothetical protein
LLKATRNASALHTAVCVSQAPLIHSNMKKGGLSPQDNRIIVGMKARNNQKRPYHWTISKISEWFPEIISKVQNEYPWSYSANSIFNLDILDKDVYKQKDPIFITVNTPGNKINKTGKYIVEKFTRFNDMQEIDTDPLIHTPEFVLSENIKKDYEDIRSGTSNKIMERPDYYQFNMTKLIADLD